MAKDKKEDKKLYTTINVKASKWAREYEKVKL